MLRCSLALLAGCALGNARKNCAQSWCSVCVSLGFSSFLESDECLIAPAPDKTPAQLNLPLSHYYISGAHDAYVPDDPAANTASMDAIVRALAQPCRYVKSTPPLCSHLGKTVTEGFSSFSQFPRATEVLRVSMGWGLLAAGAVDGKGAGGGRGARPRCTLKWLAEWESAPKALSKASARSAAAQPSSKRNEAQLGDVWCLLRAARLGDSGGLPPTTTNTKKRFQKGLCRRRGGLLYSFRACACNAA